MANKALSISQIKCAEYKFKLSQLLKDTLNEITDIDSYILGYLIEKTIYKYMSENYDNSYKLPVTRDY